MTGQPFLALITPLGGDASVHPPLFPTNPIVVPPGGAYPPWPPGVPGGPQHPIWGPPGFNPPGAGMPPGIWPGPNPPYVDAGFPMPQPPFPPSGRPPGPQHPIWGPPGFNPPGAGMPPGIWGGGGVGNYPDAGFPGPQPGQPGGGPPLVLWGPIREYIDAGFPEPQPPLPPVINDRPVDWKVAWTPTTGWVVVGIPTGPTPTPSASKPAA